MSKLVNLAEVNAERVRYVQWWVISIVTVPTVLDYIFIGSPIARYSRVLIFLAVSVSILVNHQKFLKSKLIGLESLVLTFILYAIGTLSALSHGGVITPNIASLLILMLIVSANIDLHRIILKSIALSVHILVGLSVLAIVLKLNPRNYYSTAEGYPVFLNFIGIPGRNCGIFIHPNTLGQAAALSTLFMIEAKVKRVYLLLPLLCMIKCGSRTSILGILTGLLVYSVIRIFKSRQGSEKPSKLESPLVIGTLLLGILVASSAQFLNYIKFLDPSALTDRVGIWQVSLTLFKSSSIFGLGWGWESRAIQSQLLNVWAVSAHNAILEIAFSAGIVGLVIFLFMLTKGLVYFSNLLVIEKMMLASILVSGISEAYIDLQYPTLQTVLFFVIIIGASKKLRLLND